MAITGQARRRRIILNADAYISGATSNVPVLVKFNSTSHPDLFATGDDKDSVWFSSDASGQTILYHEGVVFSATDAIFYVKVDLSSTADTTIYFWYGTPSITGTESKTNVWTNGVGVYHFESGVTDSSENQDGTANSITYTTGYVGSGAVFNGTADYIAIGNSSDWNYERTQAMTFSWWTNRSSYDTSFWFSKQEASTNYRGFASTQYGGKLTFELVSTPTYMLSVEMNNTGLSGQHFYTWTYSGNSDASGVKLYIDADSKSLTNTKNNLGTNTILNSITPQIGNRNGAYNLNCTMDEFWFFSEEKSADFIKAVYNNVQNYSTFVTIDGAVNVGGTPKLIHPIWTSIENYNSSVSAGLGLSATVSTQATLHSSVAGAIGLSATVAQQKALARSVSASVGLSASALLQRTYTKAVSASLGLSASISQQKDLNRSVSASLGLSASVQATRNTTGTVSANLGLSASVTYTGQWKAGQYWKIIVTHHGTAYNLGDLNILRTGSFSDEIGKRADQFSLEIYNNDGSYNDVFDVGDSVLIYLDTDPALASPTLVFNGYITDVEIDLPNVNENIMTLSGEDYGSVRMRQSLIEGVYEKTDTAISDIVKDVFATYCPDISTTGVDTFSTSIDYVKFAWQTVWQAVEFLASLAGADYYVDENLVLYFYDTSAESVSHSFTDWNLKSLKIKKDSNKAFDRVFVVGGKQPYLDQSTTTVTTATKMHDKYYATMFTPTISNLLQIELYIDKVGVHSTDIEFEIVADDSGPLGDIAAYGTIKANKITGTAGWVKSTMIDKQLSRNTNYWLVLPMVGSADLTYQMYVSEDANGHKYSTDKASWTAGTGKIAFKTYYGVQIVKSATAAVKMFTDHYTNNAIVDFTVSDTDTAQELATQKISEYALKNATDMVIYSINNRVRSGQVVNINSTAAGIDEDQVVLSVEYNIDGSEIGFINEIRVSCTKSDDFFIHFAKMFEELRRAKVEAMLSGQSTDVDYKQTEETVTATTIETIDDVLTSTTPKYDDGTSRWGCVKWMA